MTLEGAIIKEQGVTFGIAIVKESVMRDMDSKKASIVLSFQEIMRVDPVVLMTQDHHGTPTFYGRTDVVKFLANIDIRRIPWKRYTFTS